AEVVHDRVVKDGRLAGVGVDLDFADVGAVRIRRLVLNVFAEPLEIVRIFRGLRYRGEVHRTIGADDPRHAVHELDVGRCGLQFVGGDLADLFGQILAGTRRRNAAQRNRTRTARAAAFRKLVGIALAHLDLRDIDVELLGNELRVGGRVALAVRLGADEKRDAAVTVQPDMSGLGSREGAGLDVGRHADAAQLAAPGRLLPTLFEALPVGALHRRVHVAVEFTHVIHAAGRRGVRELFGLDEVAAANLVGRQLQVARAGVRQLLDQEGRLGPAGAAIGID